MEAPRCRGNVCYHVANVICIARHDHIDMRQEKLNDTMWHSNLWIMELTHGPMKKPQVFINREVSIECNHDQMRLDARIQWTTKTEQNLWVKWHQWFTFSKSIEITKSCLDKRACLIRFGMFLCIVAVCVSLSLCVLCTMPLKWLWSIILSNIWLYSNVWCEVLVLFAFIGSSSRP